MKAVQGFRRGVSVSRQQRWLSVASDAQEEPEIFGVIKNDIETYPLMVYMKGTPEAPQCGFSKQVVQLLQATGSEFASRDVLSNEDLRAGIKQFTEWPTIPQVFIGGEFIGGSDIVLEMFKNGELETALKDADVKRHQ